MTEQTETIKKRSTFTFNFTNGEKEITSLRPGDFKTIIFLGYKKEHGLDLIEAEDSDGNRYKFLGNYWNGE